MKKILLLLFIITITTGTGFTQTIYDQPLFSPINPQIIAQGGSFTSVAEGYCSLFTNPAGFARTKKGSLTISSANLTGYFPPTSENIDMLIEMTENPETAIIGLSDLLTGNGFGLEIASGIGYVGHGLGIGLIGTGDLFAYGPNIFGVTVNANTTVGFIGGLGFPLNIGKGTLYIGGDVRPMYRINAPEVGILDFMSLMNSEGGSVDFPVLFGLGIGVDLGAIWEIGPFNIGFAVRDLLGTKFYYSEGGITQVIDSLSAGEMPQGEEIGDKHVIPMNMSIGGAFQPDLGVLSYIIEPVIHAEYQYVFTAEEKKPSFWTGLHAGAEIKLFKFIKLRAGINQGYITGGAGLKLLFLDINAAFFTREMGNFTGSMPNTGVTAEIAMRF